MIKWLLVLLHVHKDIVKKQIQNIIENVIKLFCMVPRRVQFLFNH